MYVSLKHVVDGTQDEGQRYRDSSTACCLAAHSPNRNGVGPIPALHLAASLAAPSGGPPANVG